VPRSDEWAGGDAAGGGSEVTIIVSLVWIVYGRRDKSHAQKLLPLQHYIKRRTGISQGASRANRIPRFDYGLGLRMMS